jgi:hypothetical protein
MPKQYTENVVVVARHQNSEYSNVFVSFLEWVHLARVPAGIGEEVRLTFGTRARLVTMSTPLGSSHDQISRHRGSPSPAPCGGRCEVVVHHTIAENTTAGTQFPMLTHTNY